MDHIGTYTELYLSDIFEQCFQVFRSPANIARFFMLKHDKVKT
jgi:hypothetical protein